MARFRTDATKAGDLAYKQEHREQEAARTRAWNAAHPEEKKQRNRQYKIDNRESIAAKKREWRLRNPERHNAANKRWKINRILKLCDYDALLLAQGSRCAICGADNPQRKQSGRFCIDHCHATGRVRGLLCHPCNAMLGLAKDNKEVLAVAITYLGAT